jgi:hypothetical protein
VPLVLALLKCPAGALTAILGIVLLRAALTGDAFGTDTPTGLLAWAVIFGASQQLLTRLADLQGEVVLDQVKSGTAGGKAGAEE